MITFWQQENGKFIHKEQEELDTNSPLWVDARNVNREDMRILEEDFHIQQEHILDILDQDELSRIEKEDDYLLIIVRLPVFVPDADVSYFTIPLGIILYENMFITICWTDCEVLKDISSNRLKGLNLSDFPSLLTRILSRADTIFLRYLKEINRRSTTIQNELQLSIKNIELIQLSNLEKSLVYFTTSLKSNQLLLEKLTKTRYLTFDEDDRDWLEGVEIDNRQAIEMTDTYSDILSGMMDAFASVISNNLNIVMKKLTIISLILMIPTFIVSFFGMNVPLPFENNGWIGVIFVIFLCGIATFIAARLLLKENATEPKNRPGAILREERKKARLEKAEKKRMLKIERVAMKD